MVGPVNAPVVNPDAHPDVLPNSLSNITVETEPQPNEQDIAKEAYIAVKQDAIAVIAALASLAEEAGYEDEKVKIKKIAKDLTEML